MNFARKDSLKRKEMFVSSGKRSRINRVYTDIKIVDHTKINHIMVSFADNYIAIFLSRLPLKTKIGKD